MAHDHAEGGEETKSDLDVGAVALTGIVGFALLYVTVVALTAFFTSYEEQQKMRIDAGEPYALAQTRAAQLAQLNDYAKKPDGKIRIPIDRAMELIVAENSHP